MGSFLLFTQIPLLKAVIHLNKSIVHLALRYGEPVKNLHQTNFDIVRSETLWRIAC